MARTAFPVIKDLVVDRGAFDRIIVAGGYVSVPTGSPQDGEHDSGSQRKCGSRDGRGGVHWLRSMRCGVSQCVGGAVHRRQDRTLRTAAAGQPERPQRALNMVRQYNAEGFGSCTNIGECEAACPKQISLEVIARMNRDFIGASFRTALATLRF